MTPEIALNKLENLYPWHLFSVLRMLLSFDLDSIPGKISTKLEMKAIVKLKFQDSFVINKENKNWTSVPSNACIYIGEFPPAMSIFVERQIGNTWFKISTLEIRLFRHSVAEMKNNKPASLLKMRTVVDTSSASTLLQ